jgi:fructokinase
LTLYAGIEAGGTKFVCVLGEEPDAIVAEERIETTTPAETIKRALAFFRRHAGGQSLAALGIGSFGPIDLSPVSPTYGHLTTTPKPGWARVDLCTPFREELRVPVVFDTDVNAAAFGEYYWISENRVLDPLLYVTIGTGIGVGAIVNGKPLRGLIHPEAGHMMLPHDPLADPFRGVCPYHGDCWEGLASGPALESRWGCRSETLASDHPAWVLEVHYLAVGVTNLIYCLSPRRVILGGGVMQHPGLLERVRSEIRHCLAGYLQSDRIAREIDRLIVPPALGTRSGALGALALARTAAPV